MSAFFSILGFIFVIIILKFVYDTYLTNNTEKRWQEHVKNNAKEAEHFERKLAQTQNVTTPLRYKGVYLYKDVIEVPDGSKGVNVHGLFFTDEDVFYFSTVMDYSLNRIIENLPTLFTPQSFAYREAVTTYTYFTKLNFVLMKFKDVPDWGDLNCSCSLAGVNMLVTITKDFEIDGQVEKIPFLTKRTFTFHPIK